MNNNQTFLELYRRLEMYLDGKYHYAESPIKEYIHELERSMIGEDTYKANALDFLRILRNNLTHRDVSSFVEVTDGALNFLQREIDRFENPIEAEDVMLPFEKLFSIHLKDSTLRVLHEIYKNSYDIIPVLNDEQKVIGVFSLDVMLKDLYLNKPKKITSKSTIEDFKELLELDDQNKERFEFVSFNEDIFEVMARFNKKNSKKLKMLFVTQSGDENTKLLGIITPHDIIHRKSTK